MRRAALLLLVACAHAGDVSTVEVRKDDLVIGVEVIGELEAVDSLDVKPPPIPDMWDFKIAQMASEGDDVKDLDGFSDDEVRLIMRENALELSRPRPR